MADTQVTGDVRAFTDQLGIHGPYWTSVDVGVIVYSDGAADLSYARTINGGVSWTVVEIGTGTEHADYILSCWFDKETPGDTGNKVHIFWGYDSNGSFEYVNLDVATNTVGSVVEVVGSLTFSSTLNNLKSSITKTKGGNLIVYGQYDTSSTICYKSINGGTTWSSITSPWDGGGFLGETHLLFPANTTDDDDCCSIRIESGFGSYPVSIEMYDDSANTWTETSIFTISGFFDTLKTGIAGAVRHSDGNIILAAHSNVDTTGDDLVVYDIDPSTISSVSSTALTNIFTNQAASAMAAVVINQQNDDIYVAYAKGGTWETSVDIVFHKSTNDGSTWGTEQSYSEATADDLQSVGTTKSIDASGGRIQWSFYNDDTTDIWVNLTNDIEITAATSDKRIFIIT